MNAKVIKLLNEYEGIMAALGEEYREIAYAKAVSAVRGLEFEITLANVENVRDGIGARIYARIVEFLTTGKIAELEKFRETGVLDLGKSKGTAVPGAKKNGQKSKLDAARVEFGGIMGMGPAGIAILIGAGLRSLLDLRRAVDRGEVTLNRIQMLGLKYYDDLAARIPRDEVTVIGGEIRAKLTEVGRGASIVSEVVGSYRRGAMSSGDVDILASGGREGFVDAVLAALRADVRFVDVVVAGPQRLTFLWRSGAAKGPGTVRQVDILHVAPGSYVCALNYFTGSQGHNLMLRGMAKKKGLRLNQLGLFNGETRIEIASEKQLYEVLGLEYIPPEKR